MATYRDLQDRINLDYINRTDLIPETKRSITNAIRCYEATRFWFNETSTAVATTASQSYLAVPADYLSLTRLELSINGVATALRQESFSYLREMNSNAVTGIPTHFAYHQDRFELAIIPASAYAATVFYVRALPTLSADSDTNAWTTEAFNLIAHAATIDLITGVLQVDDNRKIERHERALYRAISDLSLRNDTRFANRLASTSF